MCFGEAGYRSFPMEAGYGAESPVNTRLFSRLEEPHTDVDEFLRVFRTNPPPSGGAGGAGGAGGGTNGPEDPLLWILRQMRLGNTESDFPLLT